MRVRAVKLLLVKSSLLVLGGTVLGAAPACSVRDPATETPETDAELEQDLRVRSSEIVIGRLRYGETSGSIAYSPNPRYRALAFSGAAGDNVRARIEASSGSALAWIVNSDFQIVARSNRGNGDSWTEVWTTLDATGNYYLIMREARSRASSLFAALQLDKYRDGGTDAATPQDLDATADAHTDAMSPDGNGIPDADSSIDGGDSSVPSEAGIDASSDASDAASEAATTTAWCTYEEERIDSPGCTLSPPLRPSIRSEFSTMSEAWVFISGPNYWYNGLRFGDDASEAYIKRFGTVPRDYPLFTSDSRGWTVPWLGFDGRPIYTGSIRGDRRSLTFDISGTINSPDGCVRVRSRCVGTTTNPLCCIGP